MLHPALCTLHLLTPYLCSYEIDRQQNSVSANEQPSLKEMASHALKYLDNADGKGFFLMIEGSRIDMAGYVWRLCALDNADSPRHAATTTIPLDTFPTCSLITRRCAMFENGWTKPTREGRRLCSFRSRTMRREGWRWAGNSPPSIPSTFVRCCLSRLALRGPSSADPCACAVAGYPDALLNATHSTEHLGALVAANPSVTRQWLREEIYGKGLGIGDVSEKEVDELWPHRGTAYYANRVLADAVSSPFCSCGKRRKVKLTPLHGGGDQISRRAQVGWSTAGHSGVDVNLYAAGYNATGLVGNRENTEIGEHIAHMMGLNLEGESTLQGAQPRLDGFWCRG